jgi:DNA adenine methylase
MKNLKTPLRYPGGKSRAITKISEFFPDLSKYDQFREPFVGGGSVALWVTKTYPDLLIWVNDLYEPLYNFWVQLQTNGSEMQEILSTIKKENPDPDRAKELFIECKNQVSTGDDLDRAVAFYIINKCSFSGLGENSSFSAQASDSNFSMNGIEKLSGYQELIKYWKITNLSYEHMLDGKGSFIYLDPPYEIGSNLYGKKGGMHKYFHHTRFSEACCNSNHNMLVSYNSSNLNKRRFADWNAAEYDHTYTMRSTGDYIKEQKKRKELVLTNYENISTIH